MAGPAIIGYTDWGNDCVINLAKLDFDPDYTNVLAWPVGTSRNTVYNWFVSHSQYTYNNQSPVDLSKGYFDIQAPYYKITDMNYATVYLGAEDETDQQPLFWGLFVTYCEQVALNTTRVYFNVDVMTTFQASYNILPPQVFLRYTPPTDNLFENLVPDPEVDIGDDTVVVSGGRTANENMSVAVLYSSKPASVDWPITAGFYYGYPCPLGLKTFNMGLDSDRQKFASDITEFTANGQEDAIAAMFVYPSNLGNESQTTPSTRNTYVTINFTQIGTYTPKNKKLFSSPYLSISVNGNEGAISTYKPELFAYPDPMPNSNQVQFVERGVIVPSPQRLVYPKNYRGFDDAYEDGMTLSACIQLPWVGDTYKAWLAQNGGSLVTSSLSSALTGAIGGFIVGGPVGAAIGAGMSLSTNTLGVAGKAIDKLNTPPQVHGQVMTSGLNYALGRIDPDYFVMSLRPDVLERIDNYWSAYGYPINDIIEMDENSITNRPHWTYIRTQACHFDTTNVQKEYADEICRIFNRGVRFWKNYSEMGNLSLDNSV